MVSRNHCTAFLLACLVFAGVPSLAGADESTDGHNPAACGINCVYAALRLLRENTPWLELAKSDYISSPQGSSLADLAKAVQDHGCYGIPMKGLSASGLTEIPWPVITNVKRSVDSLQYDHWVLVTAQPGGWLRIFDAPEEPQDIRPSQLASRWRGVGLIVADHPLSAETIAKIRWRQICQSLWYLVPLLAMAVMIRVVQQRKGGLPPAQLRRWFPEAAGIMVVAAVIGFCYHFFSDEGLLSNNDTLQAVTRARFSSFLTKIDVQEARKMHAAGVVFVDARLPQDYLSGHISKAFNIPVGAPRDFRRALMASVPRAAPIVIYCQSSSCPYSDSVAKALAEDGYTNLILFRDGWVGWIQAGPSRHQNGL